MISRQKMSVSRAEAYIDSLIAPKAKPKKPESVQTFLNHLSGSLEKIRLSGISAVSEQRETDTQIVLTITIPKKRNTPDSGP